MVICVQGKTEEHIPIRTPSRAEPRELPPCGWLGREGMAQEEVVEQGLDMWVGFWNAKWKRLFNVEMLPKQKPGWGRGGGGETTMTKKNSYKIWSGFVLWPRVEVILPFTSVIIYLFVHSTDGYHWVLVTEIGPDFRYRKSQFLWFLLLEGSSLVSKMDIIRYFPSWLYNDRLKQGSFEDRWQRDLSRWPALGNSPWWWDWSCWLGKEFIEWGMGRQKWEAMLHPEGKGHLKALGRGAVGQWLSPTSLILGIFLGLSVALLLPKLGVFSPA